MWLLCKSKEMSDYATFVVIGGGIAGVSCVENLTFLCPKERIILISESALIKTVTNLVSLGKSLTRFDVEERDVNSLKENVITIIDSLHHINSSKNEVITKNGKIIRYEYLCLCTGARPKLVEQNNEYILGIRDTDTVIEFQKRLKKSKKLILVGNGGIASEIAYEVKNVEIDWVIKDKYISSTFLDPGAAQFFQKRLQNKNKNSDDESKTKKTIKRMRYEEVEKTGTRKGAALGPDWHRNIDISGNYPDSLKIHYETEIERIEVLKNETDSPLNVILKNGEEIRADFVVSATGVNPNLNFTTDNEFKLGSDGGIFVNEMMETSVKRIYAAGDVCYAGWDHAEHWFQMRLWTQARQMGAMAGRSMTAKFNNQEIYQDFCFELFGHVTTLYGLQVVLLGKYNGQGLGNNYEALLRMTPNVEYIKFVLQNGRLKGAILIGETGLEETCENLILNQLDLTPYGDDILNPDIDIEDYFD